MKLPGYSAEASVYESAGRYQMALEDSGLGRGAVQPAQVRCWTPDGRRFFCCPPGYERGWRKVCLKEETFRCSEGAPRENYPPWDYHWEAPKLCTKCSVEGWVEDCVPSRPSIAPFGE